MKSNGRTFPQIDARVCSPNEKLADDSFEPGSLLPNLMSQWIADPNRQDGFAYGSVDKYADTVMSLEEFCSFGPLSIIVARELGTKLQPQKHMRVATGLVHDTDSIKGMVGVHIMVYY